MARRNRLRLELGKLSSLRSHSGNGRRVGCWTVPTGSVLAGRTGAAVGRPRFVSPGARALEGEGFLTQQPQEPLFQPLGEAPHAKRPLTVGSWPSPGFSPIVTDCPRFERATGTATSTRRAGFWQSNCQMLRPSGGWDVARAGSGSPDRPARGQPSVAPGAVRPVMLECLGATGETTVNLTEGGQQGRHDGHPQGTEGTEGDLRVRRDPHDQPPLSPRAATVRSVRWGFGATSRGRSLDPPPRSRSDHRAATHRRRRWSSPLMSLTAGSRRSAPALCACLGATVHGLRPDAARSRPPPGGGG